MRLNTIKPVAGSRRPRLRVGRGASAGQGKTSGRGVKGQRARKGGYHKVGFEGGQMPLQRRLPKFGFVSISRRNLEEVQVADLDGIATGGVVDAAALQAAGLVRGRGDGVVVLGKGELKNALTVKADRVTAGARATIEKAGGSVEIVPRPLTMGQKAKAARQAEARLAKAARAEKEKAEKPPKVEGAIQADKPPKEEKPSKGEKAAKGEKVPKGEKAPKGEKPAKGEKPPKGQKPSGGDKS